MAKIEFKNSSNWFVTWSHFTAVTGPKQLFVSMKFMAQLFHHHDQEGNTNYHLLLRGNWSGGSRVNQKSNHQQVCSELEAAGSQVLVSIVRCVLYQHDLDQQLLSRTAASLCEKEAVDPDAVCCWSHGQRKKPSGGKLHGMLSKAAM